MRKGTHKCSAALAAAGILCATVSSVATATGASASSHITLVYAGFGGALQTAEENAFLRPFMKVHPNITVQYAPIPDWGQIVAAVQTGNVPWNVATIDQESPDSAKYFDKLDCNIIPCNQITQLTNVNAYGSIDLLYGIVLAYHKADFGKNPPTSWADFFNTSKYPGTRVIENTSGNMINVLIEALLAAGMSPQHIVPFNFALAFKELNKLKNHVIFDESQSATVQDLYTGEAAMGDDETDEIEPADPNSKIIGVSWNGMVEGGGAVHIIKGSANEQASQELVAFMLNKENDAKISDWVPDVPSNKLAVPLANPKFESWYITSHFGSVHVEYPWPYIIANGPEITQKFEAWVSSL